MIEKWHNWVQNHLALVNFLLILVTILLGFQLRGLKFDANWLSLFSKNDPKIVKYNELIGTRDTSSLYFKVEAKEEEFTKVIQENNPKIKIIPLTKEWIKVDLDPTLPQADQKIVLTELKQKLVSQNIPVEITGPLEIFQQFDQSIQQDFNFTTLIAMGLIILTILWFYGINRIILYGFMLQLLGIFYGLVLYSFFFDNINLITATIPCILLGLGIDFSIHVATICSEEQESPGLAVYRKIAKPLFGGVITTSVAFWMLCFNDLVGLIPAGVLGGISLFTMYFAVMAFLPPFASRFSNRKKMGIHKFNLPLFATTRRRYLLVGITLIVIALAFHFIPRLQFEDKAENLYDPNLPALIAQQELTESLGLNPTPLFINLRQPYTMAQLQKLSQAKQFTLGPPNQSKLDLAIFAKQNPFDRQNLDRLHQEIAQIIGKNFTITGAPPITHHLNNLLLDGMEKAALAVFIFVFFLIWIITKQLKIALAVSFILALSMTLTLALLAIFGIKLSTYTLILLPMLLGIGVDDCLHIVFNQHINSQPIKSNDHIVKAITLTTITTIIGYGSLVAAKNQGFITMGLAATIGLTTFFIITVYLLPTLIPRRNR